MSLLDRGPCWPITCDADLTELWSALMGEGGFAAFSLWLLFLDPDDVTLPTLAPGEGLPDHPDEQLLAGVLDLVGAVHDRGGVGSFAVLLSRPGSAAVTPGDRAWAAGLTRGARERGLRMWSVHLATEGRVRCLGADDLVRV